jgi:hypothetical protein
VASGRFVLLWFFLRAPLKKKTRFFLFAGWFCRQDTTENAKGEPAFERRLDFASVFAVRAPAGSATTATATTPTAGGGAPWAGDGGRPTAAVQAPSPWAAAMEASSADGAVRLMGTPRLGDGGGGWAPWTGDGGRPTAAVQVPPPWADVGGGRTIGFFGFAFGVPAFSDESEGADGMTGGRGGGWAWMPVAATEAVAAAPDVPPDGGGAPAAQRHRLVRL